MTYEEAKIQIQAIPEKIWDQLSEPDREAMEMAFSALQAQEAKTQLSAEGTTSDLISRQEATEVADAVWRVTGDVNVAVIWDKLKNLPSAQPEIEERTEEFAQNVPKEDLISRKEAIDAINKALDRETLLNSFVRKVAVDALKTMPSAQPEPQWIPVNERMPEEDNWLGGSGKQFSDNVLISITNREDADAWSDISQTIDGEWGLELPRYCKITAWKPLPEPYRGGRR